MQQNYLKNAVLLTGSSLALRLAGMAFRVWLAAALGDEGLGLYQLILAFYSVFITLATSGVSVAATRLVAEELLRGTAAARVMVRRLAAVAAALGCAAGAVQFALAGPAARWWLGDARAAASLRTLAVSLPFMALAAVLRGAFVALRRVQPNVVSQLVEQGFRIGAVVWLLGRLPADDLAARCQAVLLGETLSEALSAGLMALFYRRACRRELAEAPTGDGDGLAPPAGRAAPAGGGEGGIPQERAGAPAPPPTAAPEPLSAALRRIWAILWPVEGGRCLSSGLHAAENLLVPACLAVYLGAAGGGRAQALAQYGALKGMALPLLSFPFSLLGSLATLLMPEITQAQVRGQTRTLNALLDRMLTLTAYAAALGGAFFRLWAQPLGQLLYGSAEVGFYLRVLAPMAPLMYLESMVDGAIKGLGEQKAAFGYAAWDSVLRIAGVVVLLPRRGMQGFLLVMLWSNLFTCLLNARRLLRVTGLRVRWGRWLAAPCAAAGGGAAAGWAVGQMLAGGPPWAQLVGGAAAMGLAWLAAAWPLGLGRAVRKGG